MINSIHSSVTSYHNLKISSLQKESSDVGQGNSLAQLSSPNGLFVDKLGTLYIVDSGNNRVIRWPKEAKEGTVIVGGNGKGSGAHQFSGPRALSFDCHGNIYVVDEDNNRVQRFSLQ
ncbi:unnamed protein product [Rotaria magnacalcarata]|nr:unnamed protein product [Rotaria magnacalcarata]